MASINITQFITEITTSSQNQLRGLAIGAATSKLKAEKKELIKEFEDHAISKELRGDADARSQFLDKGTLFSLLGFNAGTDPVGEFSTKLDKEISLNKSDIKTKISARQFKLNYDIGVNLPSEKQIQDYTPLPWVNRSWIEQIETGISDIAFYIYSKSFANVASSRSKRGLQKKNKTTAPAVYHPPSSYFTTMYKNFIERLGK